MWLPGMLGCDVDLSGTWQSFHFSDYALDTLLKFSKPSKWHTPVFVDQPVVHWFYLSHHQDIFLHKPTHDSLNVPYVWKLQSMHSPVIQVSH